MTYQVTIQPSGHQFTVKPGETLLAAALNAGFSLPYGCRNGACGACKGKVLAGSVDYGVHQEGALTHEDKLKGLALFCCAKAESDLTIEVKEVGAAKDIPIKTLPCRVERMEKLADACNFCPASTSIFCSRTASDAASRWPTRRRRTA